MRFVIYIFILSAHALCTMLSCDQEPQKTKVYNPNGDSELALLIRDLFDEAMEVKKDIKDGKTPKLRLDYDKIISAKAT